MNLHFLPYYAENKLRVGKHQDGGYVIEGTSAAAAEILYAYGVGWDISFELDYYRKMRKPFRLFDPTMFSIKNIYPITNDNFIGIAKTLVKTVLWSCYFVVLKLARVKFSFLKEGISNHTSPGFNTFNSHLSLYGDGKKKILLKIDIEENEYELFKDPEFINSLGQVVQILVEFHNVKNRLSEVHSIIQKLDSKFSLVHIHGNNYDSRFKLKGVEFPNALELTFVRNEFIGERRKDERSYPMPGLDFPNDSRKADYDLDQVIQH